MITNIEIQNRRLKARDKLTWQHHFELFSFRVHHHQSVYNFLSSFRRKSLTLFRLWLDSFSQEAQTIGQFFYCFLVLFSMLFGVDFWRSNCSRYVRPCFFFRAGCCHDNFVVMTFQFHVDSSQFVTLVRACLVSVALIKRNTSCSRRRQKNETRLPSANRYLPYDTVLPSAFFVIGEIDVELGTPKKKKKIFLRFAFTICGPLWARHLWFHSNALSLQKFEFSIKTWLSKKKKNNNKPRKRRVFFVITIKRSIGGHLTAWLMLI